MIKALPLSVKNIGVDDLKSPRRHYIIGRLEINNLIYSEGGIKR